MFILYVYEHLPTQYVCVSCVYLMFKEARREDTGCPGAGVTCSCEQPDVGSGNQTQVLCKSSQGS